LHILRHDEAVELFVCLVRFALPFFHLPNANVRQFVKELPHKLRMQWLEVERSPNCSERVFQKLVK
jgi:hypothetical protein